MQVTAREPWMLSVNLVHQRHLWAIPYNSTYILIALLRRIAALTLSPYQAQEVTLATLEVRVLEFARRLIMPGLVEAVDIQLRGIRIARSTRTTKESNNPTGA